MKSLKRQIQLTVLFSAVGLILVLVILNVNINDFLLKQEIAKARLVTDTIISFRNYLAKVAPLVKIKDPKISPFVCTPAYVTNQATSILRNKEQFYIRQVSDEYRNPNDKPNYSELKAIEYFKTHPNAREYWEVHKMHYSNVLNIPSLKSTHIFYARPLITKKSCLKCHGEPYKDVPAGLYKELVKKYSNRAFGYKEGEVRGIISLVIPYNNVLNEVRTLFIKITLILIVGFIIGTLIFFRITKLIEQSIDEILKYFKFNISKGIYKPYGGKMPFAEFEKLKKEINNTVKTIKQYQKELYKKLYYHPLSSLPNRVKFFEVISKNKKPLAIINIDKFREINAYFGPKIGDRLIIEVAKRLREIAKNFKIKIFHLDIDEFVLLFNSFVTKPELLENLEKILKILEEPYIIDTNEIIIKFRAGVSYYKREYLRAEIALESAKDLKKDIVFGTEIIAPQKTYENNLKWFKKLKKAIENDKIVPFYQPIVDKNKNIVKYEALVRLIDEDGTVVSPYYFLDIAKRTRLYLKITRSVVNKVFEDFKDKPFGVSINLDLNDIEDEEMKEFILNKINNSDAKITFEIVESEDVRESKVVKNYFSILQKLGAQLYIDDFGSGYANFDYLIKLNPDGVKIDGSLVKNILTDKNNEIIIKTIISFAKEVGMSVVAEYVENEEIFEKLKILGVDLFQGYYISPPLRNID